MPKKKGAAEVKRIKQAAKDASAATTASARARQARRGEIADEQAAAQETPRKQQRNLAGLPNYEKENAGNDDE